MSDLDRKPRTPEEVEEQRQLMLYLGFSLDLLANPVKRVERRTKSGHHAGLTLHYVRPRRLFRRNK